MANWKDFHFWKEEEKKLAKQTWTVTTGESVANPAAKPIQVLWKAWPTPSPLSTGIKTPIIPDLVGMASDKMVTGIKNKSVQEAPKSAPTSVLGWIGWIPQASAQELSDDEISQLIDEWFSDEDIAMANEQLKTPQQAPVKDNSPFAKVPWLPFSIPTAEVPNEDPKNFQEFSANVWASTANVLWWIGNIALHPLNTIDTVWKTIAGWILKATTDVDDEVTQTAEQAYDTVLGKYTDKDEFIKAIKQDPMIVAWDIASVIAWWAWTAGKLTQVQKTSQISKLAAKLKELNHPWANIDEAIKWIIAEWNAMKNAQELWKIKKLGQTAQTLKKVEQTANLFNPYIKLPELAIKGTGKALKLWAKVTKPVQEFITSQTSWLSREAQQTIKELPKEFNKAKTGDISKEWLFQDAEAKINAKIDDLEGIGKEYGSVKKWEVVANIEDIRNIVTDVMTERKLTETSLPNADRKALKEVKQYINEFNAWKNITDDELIRLRKKVDSTITWDKWVSSEWQAVVKQIRKNIDDLAKARIPWLKELDAQFAPKAQELKQIKSDLFRKWQLREDAISHLARKWQEGKLKRMEEIMPWITNATKALKAYEDVKAATSIKVWTYWATVFRATALWGAAIWAVNPVVAAVMALASFPPLVAFVLEKYGLVKGWAKSIVDTLSKWGKLSQTQTQAVEQAIKKAPKAEVEEFLIKTVKDPISGENLMAGNFPWMIKPQAGWWEAISNMLSKWDEAFEIKGQTSTFLEDLPKKPVLKRTSVENMLNQDKYKPAEKNIIRGVLQRVDWENIERSKLVRQVQDEFPKINKQETDKYADYGTSHIKALSKLYQEWWKASTRLYWQEWTALWNKSAHFEKDDYIAHSRYVDKLNADKSNPEMGKAAEHLDKIQKEYGDIIDKMSEIESKWNEEYKAYDSISKHKDRIKAEQPELYEEYVRFDKKWDELYLAKKLAKENYKSISAKYSKPERYITEIQSDVMKQVGGENQKAQSLSKSAEEYFNSGNWEAVLDNYNKEIDNLSPIGKEKIIRGIINDIILNGRIDVGISKFEDLLYNFSQKYPEDLNIKLDPIDFEDFFKEQFPKTKEWVLTEISKTQKNWHEMVIKDLIKDSIEKWHEKIYFPTWKTVSKIEWWWEGWQQGLQKFYDEDVRKVLVKYFDAKETIKGKEPITDEKIMPLAEEIARKKRMGMLDSYHNTLQSELHKIWVDWNSSEIRDVMANFMDSSHTSDAQVVKQHLKDLFKGDEWDKFLEIDLKKNTDMIMKNASKVYQILWPTMWAKVMLDMFGYNPFGDDDDNKNKNVLKRKS